MSMKKIEGLVYLPLKPEKAKISNLPLKLPVLLEDLPYITEKERIPLDVIIRGLETHLKYNKDDDYYKSYLVFFYYEKVKALINESKLKEAEEFLEKAKGIKEDYRYHFYKGLLHKYKKEYQLAEIELKIATSYKENFVLAYYELGKMYIDLDELDDAEITLKNAIEIDPDFVLSYTALGDVYYKKGMLNSALSMYKKALEIEKNLPDVYNRIGVIFNTLQRYEKAEEYFKKALSIYPHYYDALINLSFTLTRLGKPFEALTILKNLKNSSENPMVFNELGVLEMELGFYEEAYETLKEAYENHPDDQKILVNLIKAAIYVNEEYENLCEELDEEHAKYVESFMDYARTKNELTYIEDENIIEIVNFYSKFGDNFLEVFEDVNVTSRELQERISQLINGNFELKDTSIDTTELIKELVLWTLTGDNFLEMEKRATKFSTAVYGSGRMNAVTRTILRMLQHMSLYGRIIPEDFLEDVIPELQDIDWKYALTLSRYEDKIPSYNPKTGTDLVISLLHNAHERSEDDTLKFFEGIVKIQPVT